MAKVKIENLRLRTIIGTFDIERGEKQDIITNIEFSYDSSKAAKTDDLSKTINYDGIYKHINKVIHQKRYYLIETIATIIADSLLKTYPILEKIDVRVRKNNVPVGGIIDHVEAQVIKSRDE